MALLVGFFIFIIAIVRQKASSRPQLNLKVLYWLLPYLIGLMLFPTVVILEMATLFSHLNSIGILLQALLS